MSSTTDRLAPHQKIRRGAGAQPFLAAWDDVAS